MHVPLLPLLPHRVRRGYLGGRELDRLAGLPNPADGSRPEDWIASTVPALNPGLDPVPNEGLAPVLNPASGAEILLKDLFAAEPAYYLGAKHVKAYGPELGFLAKLLDSSIRLHVQAHPTAAFAQEHLDSRFGKLEAYVVLSVRADCDGYILLGFQRPPAPAEWERIVREQDLAAMHACFDKISVRPGEVWLVPGGLPHAIGEGVLMLEVMEPTDLVVRCEFEREGIVVPPEARFMGRDLPFAMQVFDFTPRSVQEIRAQCRIAPKTIKRGWNFANVEQVIGPAQTKCFSITRLRVGSTPAELPGNGRVTVGLVTSGQGSIKVADHHMALSTGKKFLLAAQAPAAQIAQTPGDRTPLTILLAEPG